MGYRMNMYSMEPVFSSPLIEHRERKGFYRRQRVCINSVASPLQRFWDLDEDDDGEGGTLTCILALFPEILIMRKTEGGNEVHVFPQLCVISLPSGQK